VNIPAKTYKSTSIIGFDLFRISSEGNKIVEMWQQFANGKWL